MKNVFDLLIMNEIERHIFCNNNNCKMKTTHIENITIYDTPKNLILFFDNRNNSHQIISKI